MAKTINSNKHIKISANELKISALNEVLCWATLNDEDINEDFYLGFQEFSLPRNRVNKNYNPDKSELIHFTNEEKEIMRKEFLRISKHLFKRKAILNQRLNKQ